MHVFTATVALLGLGLATSAQADWQYAKWGMTKKEIIAASKGEAREYKRGEDFVCNNDRKVIAVIAKKVLAGTAFTVAFCAYADGKLSSVRLDNSGANTYQLRETMLGQYGVPISNGRDNLMWNDRKSGNAVIFTDQLGIGTGAMIEYKPLGGSGL
jgi:hypothetical protein